MNNLIRTTPGSPLKMIPCSLIAKRSEDFQYLVVHHGEAIPYSTLPSPFRVPNVTQHQRTLSPVNETRQPIEGINARAIACLSTPYPIFTYLPKYAVSPSRLDSPFHEPSHPHS